MYSFILLIPESFSKIKYLHICKCGNIYEDLKEKDCYKCGNKKFYYYDDILNNKLKPYLIENKLWGYEYPVYNSNNEKIEIKRKIFFEIKNPEIIEFYTKDFITFGDFIKSYLLKNGYEIKDFIKYEINPYRWYQYYLYKNNPEIILLHEDFAMYHLNKKVNLIIKELVQNEPKSIKISIFEKFDFITKRNAYNPLFDEIILKSISNIDYKREFIKSTKHLEINFYNKNFIEEFVGFLKNYDESKRIKFFKALIKDDLVASALKLFTTQNIKPICKNILDNFYYKNFKFREFDTLKINEKFNGFNIKSIMNNKELVLTKLKMHNCLSNYSGKINKERVVLKFYKHKKIYAVDLDLQNKKILEAKGIANKEIDSNDFGIIKQFCKEKVFEYNKKKEK